MIRRLAGIVLAGALVAPPAAANPVDCANPCTIAIQHGVYTLPLTAISSGTDVRWTADEGSHPTAESYAQETACFNVPVGVGVDPEPVRFDVGAEGLTATTNGITIPCATAVPAGPGVYALHFVCLVHTPMHGALLVHQ